MSSTIQGLSRGTEKRSETSKDRRSQRIRDRKNIKQEESEGSSKISSTNEKKTKNLENTKKVVAEFERRMEKGSFRSRNLKEGVMLEL